MLEQVGFGDPADDLNVATIIFLIQGQIVLLRPRRSAHEEVKYDLQVLAEQIEFYWTHLSGIGPLENSLWGWNGKEILIWLDALTIEKVRVDEEKDTYEVVNESAVIVVEFYPLGRYFLHVILSTNMAALIVFDEIAVLMEKGIVVGVSQETSLRRSLDFAMFRMITTVSRSCNHRLLCLAR